MHQSFLQIIYPLLFLPPLILIYWRIKLKKLKTYKSDKLGTVQVLQKYNGEKLLIIGSKHQGVSIEKESIKKSYWYKVAYEVFRFCKDKNKPKVVMLGLGANTISSLIHRLNPRIRLTVVEFDETIVQACRDYFNLNNTPMKLVQLDAFRWVGKESGKFDSIIVDIFTSEDLFLPPKSNQPSFIKKLLPHLKTSGQLIFNRPYNPKRNQEDIKKLNGYLKVYFKKVRLFEINDPRGYINNVVIGYGKIPKQ